MEEIELKVDKKKAFIVNFPFVVTLMFMVLYGIYFLLVDSTSCKDIFGVNSAFFMLLTMLFVFPILFFMTSLSYFYRGYKTLKYKYYPPLGTPVFKKTKATKGFMSYLRGFVLLMAPFFCAYLMYLGYISYQSIVGDKTMSEYISIISEKNNCI